MCRRDKLLFALTALLLISFHIKNETLMKHLFSLMIFILASSQIQAQFKAGDNLVGLNTSLGYNRSKNFDLNTQSSSNSFSLGLGGDYMQMKSTKHGLGFRVRTGINKGEQTLGNASTSTNENGYSGGVDVFARNYFNLTKKVYFHLEYGLGINVNSLKRKPVLSTSNSVGLNGYVTPGITFLTNKRMIVEANLNALAALGYYHTRVKSSNFNTDQAVFSFNTNLFSTNLFSNISFGVKWLLK